MSSGEPSTSETDMDLTNSGRGVWLIKVPKYIANKWKRAPENSDIGKLKICKIPGEKSKVTLTLSQAAIDLDKDEAPIPKEHQLDVTTVTKQLLGVFSQESAPDGSNEKEKLYMEGRVVQKLDCRPFADKTYMNLKAASICRAATPARSMRQLDRPFHQPFKPVSNHKHNIEYLAKKKAEGKRVRDDREAVLEMLFAAFEKHQYYNIKDLVKITRQPITYLKDILKDVCMYNLKNPHRNMWELKPEYRFYKTDEKIKDDQDIPATDTGGAASDSD